jgi:putative ABC transport system permease protein
VNTAPPIFVGLGLANALVALCGAVVAQQQGFADVNMGIGFVIVGFAALIVGEAAVAAFVNVIARAPAGPMRLLPWDSIGELIAAAAGACLYFLAIGVCLRLGLAPTDLRLATSILVILGIAARLRGPLVETHLRGRW